MKIGEVAERGGVNLQTIRYYEREGLLPQPPRLPSGYRTFSEPTVRRVRFIKRAQELGFSLEEVRELLLLEDGADRVSIRRVAGERLSQIEAKLADLKRMQRVLKDLLTECEHTGAGLPCPIIGTIRSAAPLQSKGPGVAAPPRAGPTTAARKAASVQEHRPAGD